VISTPTKAWVAAILSTLVVVIGAVAPFLPENFQAAAYAVAAVLGVVGVPFGVYVAVNKPVQAFGTRVG
jgi:hypothetical protein